MGFEMRGLMAAFLVFAAFEQCALAQAIADSDGKPKAKDQTEQAAEKATPAAAPQAAPEPQKHPASPVEPIKDDQVQSQPYSNDHQTDEKLRATIKTHEQEKPIVEPFYVKLCKPDDPPVDLNVTFDAASVNDIVPAFSQILKFNYMIDPQAKGAVTMSVNAKMTPLEVWQMFEQILWLSGAYCSMEGGVIHVLPFSKMPQERKAMADHEPIGNVEVRLIPIRSASSKDLVEKIKPFLTEGAAATDIPHQNSILVVESPANLPKINSLIKLLDRKNKSNWPQAVIRCENVSATRIKSELASLLPVLGFPVTTDNVVAEPGTIHLVSLDRLQAIVATAANQEALDELTHWVGVLDRADVGEQERVFVYKVVNGKAEELTQALSAIFNVEGSSISPSASSSSSSSSASQSQTASKSSTQQPANSAASGVKSTQTKNENGPGSVFEIPVKIFSDAVQNRLVIRTIPRTYAMINAILVRLDTAPSQVLLQVTVSEITLDDTNSFGVEFSGKVTGGKNSVNSVFGTNYSNLNPGSSTDYGGKYYIYNPNDPSSKFGYLKALAGKSKLNVLSSPQIVVVSHSEAKISVGDKVPIVTNEITDTASTSTTSTALNRSIQYQDTGIILTVTPHVTKGGMVTMDIQQEVSNAVPTTSSGLDSPTIQQRLIKTSMSIKDGSTLFVAGLIKEQASETISSIPIFWNSEFLSKLFGSSTSEKIRTEIIMMITVRIIDEKSNVEDMVRRYKQAMEMVKRSENLDEVDKFWKSMDKDKDKNKDKDKDKDKEPDQK